MTTSVLGNIPRHNARIKRFGDGSAEVLICNRQVFRESGWEDAADWNDSGIEPPPPPYGSEAEYAATERTAIREAGRDEAAAAAQAAAAAADALRRAQRRARTQVRDFARCNRFKWFVTLTLDASRIDRRDVAAITRKLNQWLDNQVRRNGLAYVLVPELHKDGAVHFHGLFNDSLRVVDSGTVIPPQGGKPRKPRSARQRAQWLAEGGHIVYNLPTWTLGFTTAIELYGDYQAAVGYVCKYISKEGQKVGGRWFYHGGGLKRPDVELCDLNIEDFQTMDGARSFESETLPGAAFCVVSIDGEEVESNGRGEEQNNGAREPRGVFAARVERGEQLSGSGASVHGRGALR